MTAPSITYGHGKLEDSWATLSDDYTFTSGGSTGTYGVTTTQNLYIDISAYVGDAYLTNDDNFTIDTTLYPYILFRYYTTGSAKCKIVATFSDAVTQTVLDKTASSGTWTYAKVTLTPAKILDHLSFYCAESATGLVYYDFFLVCAGVFSFPQYSTVSYNMRNRYSNTEVPSRIGRRKAWMGADELIVSIEGDVDSSRTGWKRTLDTNAAQVLEDIHHKASSEAWQWLITDRAQFKAVMENLIINERQDQDYLYAFQALFSEYRLSDASNDSLKNRLGIQ